jgi:hypothetical protein
VLWDKTHGFVPNGWRARKSRRFRSRLRRSFRAVPNVATVLGPLSSCLSDGPNLATVWALVSSRASDGPNLATVWALVSSRASDGPKVATILGPLLSRASDGPNLATVWALVSSRLSDCPNVTTVWQPHSSQPEKEAPFQMGGSLLCKRPTVRSQATLCHPSDGRTLPPDSAAE